MYSKHYRTLEFIIVFILLPVSLTFPYSIGIKVSSIFIALGYVLFLIKKDRDIRFKIKKKVVWNVFWKAVAIKFSLVALTTIAYVWYIAPNALFCIPIHKTSLWVQIILVYSLLSVWPQELVYRTFFFARYEVVFTNNKLMIFVNTLVFSLAHLFFMNTLVIVLTLIGGLVFAITYSKTKSTILVSIEHALYGNWLFTVGMGDMLAFPGMESCI